MEGIILAVIGYLVIGLVRSLATKPAQKRQGGPVQPPVNWGGAFMQIPGQMEPIPPIKEPEPLHYEPMEPEVGEGYSTMRYEPMEGIEPSHHDHGGTLAAAHAPELDAPAPRAPVLGRLGRSQMRQAVIMAEVLGPPVSHRRRRTP